jgi:hypothetical protein
MTFGSMAAWQAWLLLFAAGGIATALFLLKVRPARVLAASLALWRIVLDESWQPTLWERVRRAVSLGISIAVALALALAATRPSRRISGASGGANRVIIIIDSSWSMLARTSEGPTRWDRAIAKARGIAVAADREVALATTADGVVEGFTADREILESALRRISPSGGSSWPRLAGSGEVHYITDGAVPRPVDRGVIVHSVFEPAANVAVTAFAVRPAGEAYLEVANFADVAQTVHLVLTRGSATILDSRLQMGAGEVFRHLTKLAGGAAAVRAKIDAEHNALTFDDEAFAWVSRADPLHVSVVGRQTAWLRQLIDRTEGVRATYVDPDSYRSGAEDVAVFDRWAPRDPPVRPALLFAPPADTPWLSGKGRAPEDPSGRRADEARPRWQAAGSHPVLRGVDPLTLRIDRARAYAASGLVPIAQSARGTPLLYAEDSTTRRLVVVAFGVRESNLSSAPAFPVLVGNALDWLARPAAGAVAVPGPVSFDEDVARVIAPGGARVSLARTNHAATGLLRAPGLYVAETGGARSTIAVNAADFQTSNLMRTTLGAPGRELSAAGESGFPWWVYCALASFALIVTEWCTWQRRITV